MWLPPETTRGASTPQQLPTAAPPPCPRPTQAYSHLAPDVQEAMQLLEKRLTQLSVDLSEQVCARAPPGAGEAARHLHVSLEARAVAVERGDCAAGACPAGHLPPAVDSAAQHAGHTGHVEAHWRASTWRFRRRTCSIHASNAGMPPAGGDTQRYPASHPYLTVLQSTLAVLKHVGTLQEENMLLKQRNLLLEVSARDAAVPSPAQLARSPCAGRITCWPLE